MPAAKKGYLFLEKGRDKKNDILPSSNKKNTIFRWNNTHNKEAMDKPFWKKNQLKRAV